MSESSQQFNVSGITARLFEAILKMDEGRKKDVLLMIGDERQYERLPYLMQIKCGTDKECFTDFILDISPGGIFLETIHPLFAGQKLELTFEFKDAGHPLVITGNVAWIGINGAGIQFVFDSREQRDRVAEHIRKLY
ncbi:MAG: PilZ domain-containing protein [Desulfobacter sp.]|nr:MAG: PilZ domain-containing protein [Desulfobacter sp.]